MTIADLYTIIKREVRPVYTLKIGDIYDHIFAPDFRSGVGFIVTSLKHPKYDGIGCRYNTNGSSNNQFYSKFKSLILKM